MIIEEIEEFKFVKIDQLSNYFVEKLSRRSLLAIEALKNNET